MPHFLHLPTAKSKLRLIVIYPGVGYGHADFVVGKVNALLRSDRFLVVIPFSHDTSWSAVQQDIERFSVNNEVELDYDTLIGWSGGSAGVASATAFGHPFSRVWLADPSPRNDLTSDPRIEMWYQPNNWTGQYASLGPLQSQMAEYMGDRAHLSDMSHDAILESVVSSALLPSISKTVVLVGALAVTGLSLALWRALRKR
jgi:hypothetical protein